MANNNDTKQKEKKSKRKVIAGVCALVATAAAIFGFIQKDNKIKKLEDELELLKGKTTIEQPINNQIQSNNTEDVYEFEDVFNEEQVDARVELISADIKSSVPEYLTSQSETERDLEWISQGIVSNPSTEEAAEVIRNIREIMYEETEDARLFYSKKEDKIENKKLVDFSNYVEDDDVRAKTLISKIYELRKGMVEAKTLEEAKAKAQEFTELFGNSWFATGYNDEISIYSLEKQGYIVLAMRYFFSTAGLAEAISDDLYYICPPQKDKEVKVSLSEMVVQMNEPKFKCPETGQYINALSAAINGMIEEVQFNQYMESRLTLQRG